MNPEDYRGEMKRPIRALLWLSLLLFSLGPAVSAQTLDVYTLGVEVDPSGQARATIHVLLDSTNVTELRVAAPGQKGARVSDGRGALEGIAGKGSILLSPRDRGPGYALTVEYTTDLLTGKSGDLWNLSLSISAYTGIRRPAAIVRLPPGASVKGFTSGGHLTAEGDRAVVEWFPEALTPGERFQGAVTYTFAAPRSTPHSPAGGAWPAVGAGIAAIAVLGVWLLRRRKKTARPPKSPPDPERPGPIPATPGKQSLLDVLNPREREVARALMQAGGRMTQRDLFDAVGIPKSTLSRTLRALERRQIVELRDIGYTNLVVLTEGFLSK